MSPRSRHLKRRPGAPARHGVALLLVMIGLVVCTILTAGFLSTQGTSLGIAKNERDAERARAIARSGLEMCIWQVKNRSDWRSVMSANNWLSNASLGGGTVTVAAVDPDSSSTFTDNNTLPVILNSTGTYSGRTYTLSATVQPTGGGTVFGSGNFVTGLTTLGNSGSDYCIFDSFNSLVGGYNAYNPGYNAILGSNISYGTALDINGWSVYRGSLVAGVGATLSNIVSVSSHGSGPASTSAASETRVPGTVIVPNPAYVLTSRSAYSRSSGSGSISIDSTYPSISLSSSFFTTSSNFSGSGLVHVTGNVTVNGNCYLTVNDGANVLLQIDGNLSVAGSITLNGSGTLTIFIKGNTTVSSYGTMNSGGSTSALILLGTSTGNITLRDNSVMVGAIYAPGSAITMRDNNRSYGALLANSLIVQDSAAFHFDEAMKSLQIHNLYGGSAPAGTADYTISITNGGTLRGVTTVPTVTIH